MRDEMMDGRGGNDHTMVRPDARLEPPSPLPPKVAFIAAYGRMAELGRHLPARGFIVVAVDAMGRVEDATVLGDRQRLIVGRHSECDLQLEDASISLRHLALLLRYDGEGPVLHAWDLATGSRFHDEEGAPEQAVVATGPLYLAIGPYSFWLVPTGGGPDAWPSSAEAAFDALPRRSFVRGLAPEPKAKAGPVAADSKHFASVEDDASAKLGSMVVGVEPPLALTEDDDSEEAFAGLVLQTSGNSSRYALSASRLARGILLGRYDRCDVTLAAHEPRVSRVHALIVRLGDETWLIDTASSNGTQRRGESVRACVLTNDDRFTLAKELHVAWRKLG